VSKTTTAHAPVATRFGDLKDELGRALAATEPIRLSPAHQFIAGKAALVFVSPTLLDASKDHAEFGLIDPPSEDHPGFSTSPPHEGARVVAWFHPLAAGKYVVDFTCTPMPVLGGESLANTGLEFVFDSSTGAAESVSWEQADMEHHVGTLFEVSTPDWLSFTLSGPQRWLLQKCEFWRLTPP
jgi:hypothetical protein